jgi:muramoyltetrapeptide carboxypeptidase
MNQFVFPPFLKPGDLVTVIATSGALKELDSFEKGLEIWRSHGYKIKLGSNWNTRYGYLAGTDTQRRQALLEAWQDPECKAILCARGGYGSARLLENWTWSKHSPKWLIGFSDVTGILWSLATENISSLHGPVLTTLANEPEWSIKRLFNYLEGRSVEPIQGNGWGKGKASGWLLPANLTVATHILNTPLHPNLEGAILALEDVTEAPYRIDRMLTQWRLMGYLEKIRGIALGRFSRCEAAIESESWTVEEVLSDRLQNLNIPIISDLPFGHDGVNAALPIGATVELDSDQGTLKILTQDEQ